MKVKCVAARPASREMLGCQLHHLWLVGHGASEPQGEADQMPTRVGTASARP